MSIRIEKYNAGRLREFIESDEYRNMPSIPVTYHRAQSWLNNPRMDPADNLMYIAFDDEELLGYRCILPDRYDDARFGWLSGNWVTPSRRRQGIASRLFEEAFSDWKGHLMFANYAPESKAVYDKTGRFRLFIERPGTRYYIRSAAASLLSGRGGIFEALKPAISLFDGFINFWQDVRLESSLKKNKVDLLMTEPLSSLDKESYEFLLRNKKLGFGQRDVEMFGWIHAYPWILNSDTGDRRYFFSSGAKQFKNHYLKILDKEGKMAAFLMLVRIDDRMTVPYACTGEEGLKTSIEILDHYLGINRISVFTTWNPGITSIMNNSRLPLLGKRKMVQKYYATAELLNLLPDSSLVDFQDGDGDFVFT
jgi:GNAT superfamily N-acetyltransferase